MQIFRQAVCGCVLATALATGATSAVAGDSRGNGGAGVPDDPVVRTLACAPTPGTRCPPNGAVVRGGRLTVEGTELEATTRVVFLGRRDRRDDVSVRPVAAERHRVEAPVSPRARSGRVLVVNRLGARAVSSRPLRVIAPPPIDTSPDTSFFLGGQRKPSFAVEVDRAMSVRVELVRESDGAVIRTWELSADPAQPARVEWDGRTADGAAASGHYRFRIPAEATGARVAPDADGQFALYDHIFPIRGPHNLGYSDTNNFGGGRNHRGQDMFARCGTRVAAARGGRVEYAGYHSAAGYYLVIDGYGTDVDYVYMHLLKPALVRTGDRAFTGQAIGEVGETGRATGCHLHFEMWSGPGWYRGGQAFDPLPALREWDAYS